MSHVHFATGILLISAKQTVVNQYFCLSSSMKFGPESLLLNLAKMPIFNQAMKIEENHFSILPGTSPVVPSSMSHAVHKPKISEAASSFTTQSSPGTRPRVLKVEPKIEGEGGLSSCSMSQGLPQTVEYKGRISTFFTFF